MIWRRLPVLVLLCIAAALVAGAMVVWLARADARDTSLLADIAHRRDAATAEFQMVREQKFLPVGSYFSGGYDSAVHWFRVRVRPPSNGGPVVLSVEPNFLDSVVLYYVGADGKWHHQSSGDSVAVENRSWKGPGLGFVIDPRSEGSIYYLRVRTESTVEVFLAARPLKNALIHTTQRMALHTLIFAMMALALVIACLQLFYRPSGTNNLLVLYSASYLIYSIFMLGYPGLAHPTWPAGVLAAMTDLLYPATGLTGLLFHRRLLAPLQPLPATLVAIDLLTISCIATFAMYFAGHAQLAFATVSTITLLTAPTLVAMAWTARENGHPPIASVRLFYSVFGAFVATSMLFNLGIFPAAWFHRFNVEIFGIANVILVLSLIVSRWWSSERKLAQSKDRLRAVALRQEIKARSAQLQDHLLHMLVHEVRNHLTVIQMSVNATFRNSERDTANEVVRDLGALIQDCQRFSRIERGVWQPVFAPTDLASVVFATLADLKDEDRFEVDYDGAPVAICDAAMLGVALGSLVDEVCRLSETKTKIRLAICGDEHAGWTISVAGHGQRHWPAPLSLAHADDTMANRSSLALAIAKGIIELLGGRLGLEHRGKDIRCTLTLPTGSASLSSKTTQT